MYHRDNRAFYGNGRAVHVIPHANFYFPFEENTGTISADWQDFSTRTATLVGAITWVPGHKAGHYATSYGGTDKYGDYGHADTLTNDWTISFWVNMMYFQNASQMVPSKGSWRALVGKWDLATPNRCMLMATVNSTTVNALADKFGILLSLPNGTQGYIGYYDSSVTAGVWYHLAATLKDGTLAYYVNGNAVGLTTVVAYGVVSTSLFASTAPLTAGVYMNGATPSGSNYCKIDDIIIFNKALTSTQIAEVYAGQA